MSWQQGQSSRYRRQNRVLTAGLFALFYVYILFCVDPRLTYHLQCRVFQLNSAFLAEFASKPGGIAAYLAEFFTQLDYYPWIGALALTGVALSLFVSTASMLRTVGGRRYVLLSLVPAALLVVLHNDHAYPIEVGVSVLMVTVAFWVYARFTFRGTVPRLGAFAVLAAGTFYAVGGMVLLFALVCALFDARERRFLLMAMCVGIASVLPLAGAWWLFSVTPQQAYAWPWFTEGDWASAAMTVALYAFLPVSVSAVALHRWLKSIGLDSSAGTASAEDDVLREEDSGRPWRIRWGAFFVAVALAVFLTFDRDEQVLLRLDRYAQHGQWPELLASVQRHKSHPAFDVKQGIDRTTLLVHDINRALYHRGDLLINMFAFPQVGGSPSLLLSSEEFCLKNRRAFIKRSDLFFELGQINETERVTHELWASFGNHPLVFRRLVDVNVLKGRPHAARNYLRFMEHSLLYSSWAKGLLEELERDPQLSGNAELARLRNCMLRGDLAGAPVYKVPELRLMSQLDVNPTNRMAFEYLMAYWLLQGEHGKVAANIGRIAPLQYPRIPRHCEEALLLHMSETGKRNLNVAGHEISAASMQRFGGFQQIVSRFGHDQGQLWDALMRDYGNTYWFYERFGVTGFGEPVQVLSRNVDSGASLP